MDPVETRIHLSNLQIEDENTEQAFLRAVSSTPIIDHHAHPLLKARAMGKQPLLAITSEAQGEALRDAKTSLSHFRAVKQLAAALGCEETWDAVTTSIGENRSYRHSSWIRACLSGIECVLVDDGLDSAANVEEYNFFDQYTNSRSKRIVRIEQMAESLIADACLKYTSANAAFTAVMTSFQTFIRSCISNPEVVAFKSVICYRTGLDFPPKLDLARATRAFKLLYSERMATPGQHFARLEHPGLNEYFIHSLCQLLMEGQGPFRKPIQFHTGLGDNDITLRKSSPAHMQEFIKANPKIPIVLLHAGYPYTRETGYLATVYSNVYADIGEVFPCLSRDGQEAVVRQILELCPSSKVLWSTDGHWFPETYFLAVGQIREALLNVLGEYARKGDVSWEQASHLVQDILFNNANKLYGLRLPLYLSKTRRDQEGKFSGNHSALTHFLENKEEPKFLRVYWNDMTATPRMRVIPMRRVWSMLRGNESFSFGVTKASLGLLQNDVPAPGVSPSGEYLLQPDLRSLRLGPRKGHMTVMGDFKEQDGSPALFCPRTLLQRVIGKVARQGLSLLVGFEIELLLVRRLQDNQYEPLDGDGHAWSVGRAMEHRAARLVIEEAILQLDEAGVYVEMVHPESANGQYEVILPRAPPLEAVDTLLFARDVISQCASDKGFRMTLHPKPIDTACGTAAHVHMSISGSSGDDEAVYEPFYAGILNHLPAIAAFTYSNMASYERVRDGCWAGGTWVAWGTQNRETPLRKIDGSHWELKCMDGLANPYLALGAILACGASGSLSNEALTWKDCAKDPATLSDEERKGFNVDRKLPANLNEALDALTTDTTLGAVFLPEFIERYVMVKKAELKMLEGMSKEERRRWIMERY